jgi:putative membrane protein
VLDHFSLSPLGVLAIGTLGLYELGRREIARRGRLISGDRYDATPRARRRHREARLFLLGIALILIASDSPLAYFGMSELPVHMIDHIVLMFFAPAALVAGAPLLPLAFSLSTAARRRLVGALYTSREGEMIRRVGRVALSPPIGFLALNAAMLGWHVPLLFDAAMSSAPVHGLLMEPSFVLAGLCFWPSIIASHPRRYARRLRTQGAMVIGTNLEMLLLAMSMAIFTKSAWYEMAMSMGPAPRGVGGVISPFASQQQAAAVLWICGDFWALPALVAILSRAIRRDGSVLASIDRHFDLPGAGAGAGSG